MQPRSVMLVFVQQARTMVLAADVTDQTLPGPRRCRTYPLPGEVMTDYSMSCALTPLSPAGHIRPRLVPVRPIDLAAAERAVSNLLTALGIPLGSESLARAPARVAQAYAELFTPPSFDLTRSPTTRVTTNSSLPTPPRDGWSRCASSPPAVGTSRGGGLSASLSSALAAFYERAGQVVTGDGREGSVTIIGAVSSAGGDMTKPWPRPECPRSSSCSVMGRLEPKSPGAPWRTPSTAAKPSAGPLANSKRLDAS